MKSGNEMSKCPDVSITTTSRITKSEKKAQRKLNRVLHAATRRLKVDVFTNDKPSTVIMICNAGLVTENQPSEILKLFLPYGQVDKIMMPQGESISFVQFSHTEDSSGAMKGIHGKTNSVIGRPLYLSFVSRLPSGMDNVFDTAPPGLIILGDVVTEEEEERLLECIQWDDKGIERTLKNRRVKHYGYEFRYGTNDVDRSNPLSGSPIPIPCQELLKRLLHQGCTNTMPDQLTVNEYLPGEGIPSHVDTHSAFQDQLLSLSLETDIVMEFKHPDGRQANVFLPKRSLLIMTGESRYLWSHGITPRKTDVICSDKNVEGGLRLAVRGRRTSFTFRTIRHEPCRCQYVERCNSERRDGAASGAAARLQGHDAREVQCLEDIHVHQVYDVIAGHFSSTRHKSWPQVENFVRNIPTGSLLLDVGCGNGKYLCVNDLVYKIGCDRSLNLTSICSQRSFQVFCCDALRLPVRSNVFDACLCIAVIHHFSTQERRIGAIRELVRVLRPGGRSLIYVWSMEQQENERDSNYIKSSKVQTKEKILVDPQPSHLSKISLDSFEEHLTVADSENEVSNKSFDLPIHNNRTHFEHADLLVPWHLKSDVEVDRASGTIFHRYYHVFCKGELEQCCAALPQVTVVDSYYDKGNWCVVVEKKTTDFE